MEFLGELHDADIGTEPEVTEAHRKSLRYRRAARAIILREGKIALLHAKEHGCHKLPGGGMEAGRAQSRSGRWLQQTVTRGWSLRANEGPCSLRWGRA